MISPRILREAENASSTYNLNKPLNSGQKLPKMKAKALGDVQNTLHSRPANFGLPEKSPAIKIPGKSSIFPKYTSDENNLPIKSTTSGNKLYLTPLKLPDKSILKKKSTDDADLFEMHNHVMCEQAEKYYVNDYFTEFKFSDKQIENLVRSVKISVTPVSVELYEPCEDIILPDDKKFEDKSFSLTDILNDVIAPQVPAPVMAL